MLQELCWHCKEYFECLVRSKIFSCCCSNAMHMSREPIRNVYGVSCKSGVLILLLILFMHIFYLLYLWQKQKEIKVSLFPEGRRQWAQFTGNSHVARPAWGAKFSDSWILGVREDSCAILLSRCPPDMFFLWGITHKLSRRGSRKIIVTITPIGSDM